MSGWDAVDDYFTERLVPDAAEHVLAASDAAALPAINVAPNQGKLLHLFARMAGARRVLEIGTLGGYSTIWLARALPVGGEVVTIEHDARYAEVARANVAEAGVADRVDVHVGEALAVLPELTGPFDLVFIDADKVNNPHYFAWALRLSRPGTVIVVDNVVRGGAVVDADSIDPSVVGTRAVIDLMAEDPRVDATALQTVGGKGWDGFALALVR
ncbi:O-methyltransferase [Actinokineospora sp. HUAS TT18]|uniref:O-methyltransferase n=1 Tax=Actinokineospora sp. HUAS TT18 TaxID=3447451 RepID=UPI003F527BD8